jgi:hypothetical protein
VDYVNGLPRVQNEYHLQETAALTAAPNQPFVVFDLSRKWLSSGPNRHFCFFRRDSMLGDMVNVPFVPAEIHLLLMQENDRSVNAAFDSMQDAAPLRDLQRAL